MFLFKYFFFSIYIAFFFSVCFGKSPPKDDEWKTELMTLSTPSPDYNFRGSKIVTGDTIRSPLTEGTYVRIGGPYGPDGNHTLVGVMISLGKDGGRPTEFWSHGVFRIVGLGDPTKPYSSYPPGVRDQMSAKQTGDKSHGFIYANSSDIKDDDYLDKRTIKTRDGTYLSTYRKSTWPGSVNYSFREIVRNEHTKYSDDYYFTVVRKRGALESPNGDNGMLFGNSLFRDITDTSRWDTSASIDAGFNIWQDNDLTAVNSNGAYDAGSHFFTFMDPHGTIHNKTKVAHQEILSSTTHDVLKPINRLRILNTIKSKIGLSESDLNNAGITRPIDSRDRKLTKDLFFDQPSAESTLKDLEYVVALFPGTEVTGKNAKVNLLLYPLPPHEYFKLVPLPQAPKPEIHLEFH